MLQTPAYSSLFDLNEVVMIQTKEKMEKAIQRLKRR
jgi:hypothetical protein